jgi:hypothetical protein
MMEVHFDDLLQLPPEERGGSAGRFGISISTVTVGDGNPISLPRPGVTLVVGGNNAGKSTLLRQMHARLTDSFDAYQLSVPPVLTNQKIQKEGRIADVFAWLAANAHVDPPNISRSGRSMHISMVRAVWGEIGKGGLDELGRMLALKLDARTRFDMISPASRRADFTESPSHPLHYLESDLGLFNDLLQYSKNIFGEGVTLDPLSGSLFLRFGEVSMEAPPVDAVTAEYREALADLGTLEAQGDGISSTLGLLIPLIAGKHPIAFVDEPEAFLHPPQAFKLGQAVADIAAQHRSQVIAATHDRYFVAGVLSRQSTDTAVVRLERSESTTSAHNISPSELRRVWSSAALRHSNVLDGLFHRAVVIAENERDCVFYAAALEAQGDLPGGLLPSDVLFISSHGKGGIAEIAEILSAAHVPVIAVADLDMLNNKAGLQKVVRSVRGTWTDALNKDFQNATAEFNTPRKQRTRAEINALISGVLQADDKQLYDSETKRIVDVALAVDNPWGPVKQFGMLAFRADRQGADRLVAALDAEGVVLVRVGELEGFAPSLGVAKGKAWLPAALEDAAFLTEEAVTFARLLAEAIVNAENRTGASF